MRTDPQRFAVGDEWAYRLRDDSPSERVRIIGITRKKTSARLDVTFLDDPEERVEKIPGTRLRVPWSEVESCKWPDLPLGVVIASRREP